MNSLSQSEITDIERACLTAECANESTVPVRTRALRELLEGYGVAGELVAAEARAADAEDEAKKLRDEVNDLQGEVSDLEVQLKAVRGREAVKV